jgi:histidinol phosphatase-like PHP family hydrolase
MTIPAMIDRADALGLDTIAIASHVFKPEDLQLLPKIKSEVIAQKPRCKVIIGVEVDANGQKSDGSLITDDLDDIDYVIGTIHYVPTTGIYPRCPEDNPLDPQTTLKYWQSTLFGLISNPKIHTLAHPGRMIASALDLNIYFDDILATLAQAALMSASNNINWELNELDGRKIPVSHRLLWFKVAHLAIDAGVKLVYGSDAHKPQDIGKKDFTNQQLLNLPPNCLATLKDIGL